MNTRILKKIFIAVFFILGIAEASAWGVTGHRVVAEIAENHLTNRAKRKLKKLIGKQKLAYWQTGQIMSEILQSGKNTSTWHYVNIPPQESKEKFIEQLKNNNKPNIYTAIQNVKGIIVDKNTPDSDREILFEVFGAFSWGYDAAYAHRKRRRFGRKSHQDTIFQERYKSSRPFGIAV